MFDMERLNKRLVVTWLLYLHLMTSRLSAVTDGNEHVVVPEGSDAILPCSPINKDNLVQEMFDWNIRRPKRKEVFLYDAGFHYNNGRPGQDEQFKGRVSHFPEELKFGNASIIIRNTKLSDSGDYTCIFPHLQPAQEFSIKLVVEPTLKDRSGEYSGAVSKPSVGILNITEDGALLKCEVPGASPKPKVEWQDSDGNILPAEEPQVSYRGDRYYITLLTTVAKTKTNLFHCVATQEEINHRTADEILVTYCDAAPKPDIAIISVTDSGVQLRCDIKGAFPQPKLHFQDSDGNVLPAEEPKVLEREGRYDITLITTVTKTQTNCFHCVLTQEGFSHPTDHKITLPENLFRDTCGKLTIGGFIGAMVLEAGIIAAVLVLLVATKRLTISFNKGSKRTDSPSGEPLNPNQESKSISGGGTSTSQITGSVV